MVSALMLVLLLTFGLALLVVEDVLPTGGAFVLMAVGCLIGVLYLGFTISSELGYRFLFGELVLGPVVYLTSMYVMPKTPLGRRAYLRPPEAEEVTVSHANPNLGRLIGLRARAITPLKPLGMVDFDGRRMEGVAEEGLIESGSVVLVVGARSGRLIVRESVDSTSDPSGLAEN